MSDSKPLAQVSGTDGSIEVLNDRIIVRRKGIMNMLNSAGGSQREIPLSAISEVAFKPATLMQGGQIEFVRAGGKPGDCVVKFQKKQQDEFSRLKEYIFQLMNHHAKRAQ